MADVPAITSGDRRQALIAIRDHLAAEFAKAEGQNAATLARTLTDVLKELATLDAAKERSTTDDLAARRKARTVASNQKRTASGDH